ncbi:MAG: Glyceraldehyde-3-phosphate dehydrogenase [Elusimicrobia bacterium]|nr:Glyceraldehyde-3-phosphate dehydrogenase [Elusimicrobiota bacterium]
MAVKVGINGFGRIGRLALKAGLQNKELEFVAVNDLTDAKTLAHLFKYDSTFGIYPGNVGSEAGAIVVDGKKIKVISERDPGKLPWKELGVDIVIESTGLFTDSEKAKLHLQAGAKKVIISAPAKGEDITVCMGINDQLYDNSKHNIVSNASCTTNALAPLVKVLHDNLKVKKGLMTTIHSFTNDQVTLDFPHKDLRRARTASASMIPTTTGAAKAIGLVLPELKGKLNGMSMRVPTQDVSIVDLTVEVEKTTTKEEVISLFKKASESNLKGILQFSDLPLVSRDFLENKNSCIFDADLTDVMEGTWVKVFGWYDNEWGYSNRLIDLTAMVARNLKTAVAA